MRNLIDLVESAIGPSPEIIDYYTSEGCGMFAYALWIAKGKPAGGDISMISNVDGEPWYGDGESEEPTHDFEATHAFYVEPDGRTIDVMGYRSVENMIEGFGIRANVEGPWEPDTFRSIWMGNVDSVPLYGDDAGIAEAAQIIRAFPAIYGLSDTLAEEAEPRYTYETLERMDIDDLDWMAYGYVDGQEVVLDPSQIAIKWHDDLANPEYKFSKGGMQWVRSVSFEEPVEVSVAQDGTLHLEDGHHRWFAAKKLGLKLRAVIEIKGKPIEHILALQAKGLPLNDPAERPAT